MHGNLEYVVSTSTYMANSAGALILARLEAALERRTAWLKDWERSLEEAERAVAALPTEIQSAAGSEINRLKQSRTELEAYRLKLDRARQALRNLKVSCAESGSGNGAQTENRIFN
jgi:DNA-binding transcriptional regulator YbjK